MPALHVGKGDTFVRHDVISSTGGLQYVPYDRRYQGLPVIGGDFVIATAARGQLSTVDPVASRLVVDALDGTRLAWESVVAGHLHVFVDALSGKVLRKVSAPVTAGHSYTLTLVNREDNFPNDPVYTLFDDITMS